MGLKLRFKKEVTKQKDFQKTAAEFIKHMGEKEVKITAVQVEGYDSHFFSIEDFELVEEGKPAAKPAGKDDDKNKDENKNK